MAFRQAQWAHIEIIQHLDQKNIEKIFASTSSLGQI
jgi:hypothetical protein